MLRISSILVTLCLWLLFRGAVKVGSEETQTPSSEDELSRSIAGGQNTAVGDSIEVSTDRLPDGMPQEPYPLTVQDTDANVYDDLVPPTPTLNTHNVLSIEAKGSSSVPTTVTTKDASRLESTASGVDYRTDISEMNAVPKAVFTNTDIKKPGDEKNSAPNVENRQLTVNDEAATSNIADTVSKTSTQNSEPDKPSLSDLTNKVLQTETVDADQVSHKVPQSDGEFHDFDIRLATEALNTISPGTWDGTSIVPLPAGDISMESSLMQDVVPTQFSVGDEDGQKKGEGEEFPTFDKWSMQYLAKQEKQKIEKEQEQAVNPVSSSVQKKLRQNFAAATCGAKVIASNAEAENNNYLLNGNPDEYMLSPCKTKKWFVVELCEPVQVHKVELGTFELFSSQPKSFRVSASQRYPTKEWTPLGKFDMTPERVIQSFNTLVNEEFVKFVRVEILEHHGDEHYCPVTSFRVLGVDISSDEEDGTDHEIVETDDEKTTGETEEDEVEESVNLFTSAKDTVVKLVKKVLYKGVQEDIAKGGRAGTDNATDKAEEKKDGVAPCPNKSKGSTEDDAPSVHIPEAGVISSQTESKEPEEVPIVTKLADTEQLPMVVVETPIVVKLDKDAYSGAWDYDKYNSFDLCSYSPWNSYVQMMVYAKRISSTCPAWPKASPEATELSSDADKDTSTTDSLADHVSDKPETSGKVDVQQGQTSTISHPVAEDATSVGDGQHTGKKEPEHKSLCQTGNEVNLVASCHQSQHTQEDAKVSSATSQQPTQAEGLTSNLQHPSFISSSVTATRAESLEPSSHSSQDEEKDAAASLTTPGLHIQQSQVVEQGTTNIAETIFLKVSPSPTLSSEDLVVANDMSQETPTASEQQGNLKAEDSTTQLLQDRDPDEQPDISGSQIVSDQTRPQTQDRDGTEPAGSKSPKSADLVKVSLSSSSKRDMSIMKLSNRIMALEQNVSMTKKYLEELSHAFKQQNEDMMRLLNKTEKRLNVYVAQSEERELRQQAVIDVQELRVANLTQVVDQIQLQINTLGRELRDAQFLLAFFQAMMFIWLLIMSYRGRGTSPLVYTDHQFLLDTMPTKPKFEQGEVGSRQRRNSDVGAISTVEPAVLKRQISEANLVPSGSGSKQQCSLESRSSFLRESVQISKKRKKKKLKQPQLSLDSASSLTNNGSIPSQCSSFSSSAGVLFGTCHPKDSIQDFSPVVTIAESQSTQKDTKASDCKGQQSLLVCSHFNSLPSTAEPVHRQLAMKNGTNCHDMSNSSLVRKQSLPNGNLLVSSHVSVEDRLPKFHYNGQPSVESDSPLLKSQPDLTLSQVASPEFKLPLYHRNKVRKLGESSSGDSKGNSSCRIVKGRPPSSEMWKRRRSAGFINPEVRGEFFLAENYLSENRFKFPSSSLDDSQVDFDFSSGNSSALATANGPSSENQSSMILPYQPKKFFSLPSAHIKEPPHHKSTPSLQFLASQTINSKPFQHCQPHISSDHDTAQASFISAVHIPQPLLQLSSRNARAVADPSQTGAHQHHHPRLSNCSSTQESESRPAIPSVVKYGLDSFGDGTNCDVRSRLSSESIAAHPDGGSNENKPRGVVQTHRRHGSLPLDQLRPSRSLEKDVPSRGAKHGSSDVQRQMGRLSSGSLQGSNVKKSFTNTSYFSKKGLGNKSTSSDGASHLPSSKKAQ